MYKAISAVVSKVNPEVVLLLKTGGEVTVRGKNDGRYRIGREVEVCFDYTEDVVKEVLFDEDETTYPLKPILIEEGELQNE